MYSRPRIARQAIRIDSLRVSQFQGLAAGTGIGTGVGAGLGTLTGTLVGGTTSLATGGLGAAVGSGAGAVHGPFINVAEKAGGAVAKVTGTIPGWEATGEQKKALEQMMGQVEEQEVPTEDDLQAMSSGAAVKGGGAKGKSGKEDQGGSWTQSAASLAPSKDSLPSMPSWGGGGSTPKPDNRPPSGQPGGAAKQKDSSRDDPSIQKERTQKQQTESKEDSSAKPRPRKLNAPRGDQHPTQQSPTAKSRSDNAKRRASKASGPSSTDTKSSGKQNGATPSQPARSEKKQPRKLEVRSGKS